MEPQKRQELRQRLKDKIAGKRNAVPPNKHNIDLCGKLLESGVEDPNLLRYAQALNVDKLKNALNDIKTQVDRNAGGDDEEMPPGA